MTNLYRCADCGAEREIAPTSEPEPYYQRHADSMLERGCNGPMYRIEDRPVSHGYAERLRKESAR